MGRNFRRWARFAAAPRQVPPRSKIIRIFQILIDDIALARHSHCKVKNGANA
jgi:hypothetical protein